MDVDANSIGNTQKTDVSLISDPKVGLSSLITALQSELSKNQLKTSASRNKKLLLQKRKIEKDKKMQIKNDWTKSPMSPTRMMHEISKSIPENTILVDDSVTSKEAIFKTMNFNTPNTYYSGSKNLGNWKSQDFEKFCTIFHQARTTYCLPVLEQPNVGHDSAIPW